MRVPISVNGRECQWVRLDTGCATALQWVTSDVPPEQCGRKMAIGLAEISIPQTETTVRIGEHEFEKVPTGLHESHLSRRGWFAGQRPAFTFLDCHH